MATDLEAARFSNQVSAYRIDGERLGKDETVDRAIPFEGVNSAVFPVICLQDPKSERLALKMIYNIEEASLLSFKLKAAFERNFTIVARLLPHPNLLKVYTHFNGYIDHIQGPIRDLDLDDEIRRQRTMFLVSELGRMSLKQYLRVNRATMNIVEMYEIVEQVICAIAHLEQNHVAHCDIKADNIVRTQDGRWVLIDFGEAKDWELGAMKTEQTFQIKYLPGLGRGGAPAILAPEIYHAVEGQILHYHKMDAFGVGCLIYHMVLGDNPFKTGTLREQQCYEVNALPQFPAELTSLHGLACQLLQCDTELRLSARQALPLVRLLKANAVLLAGQEALLLDKEARLVDKDALLVVSQHSCETIQETCVHLMQQLDLTRASFPLCTNCTRPLGGLSVHYCCECGVLQHTIQKALDHLYGRVGLTQNWRKGLQLLSVLADAGDAYAMALYGWALSLLVGIRGNIERGKQLLLQSKHVIARAYCTLYGIGTKQDNGEAYRLLSTECDTSDPHVQFLLGECYLRGYGCTQDKAKAIRCYERAGNHVMALNNLATLLNQGDRPIADRHRAIALLRQSATQGNGDAQYALGKYYERGIPDVLEKDIEQAKHWDSLAAEYIEFRIQMLFEM